MSGSCSYTVLCILMSSQLDALQDPKDQLIFNPNASNHFEPVYKLEACTDNVSVRTVVIT